MPNEFIARNGVISRGNLIVSGSITSTQAINLTGSLGLTGSLSLAGNLNFQPSTSGASRYISMSASPTTASGNNIVIQAGDATASGTGGSVSIQPGGGAGGPGGGTVILSNTSWWNGATVYGTLTATNAGPNTGTVMTLNAGGGIAMKWDWDNINLVNTVSSATDKILRFTGATQYQVRGSGATSSTTAFQVQNSNASASLSVRDDGLVTVGGSIGLPVSSYVYWGDTNSSVQHTGAAMNFRTYQSGFGWNFIYASDSSVQASINSGQVRAKTLFSSTGNSPVTMSGWDGGGGTAGNVLLVKGGNSGVAAQYAGGNAGDLILENGLATDNSSGNGGTPGSIIFKYGTYNNTASVEYGRLNSSGNFLIGTTAGSAKLLISGSSSSTLLKIDSTASSSILVVSGSGRVGIGTSTPSATFTVGNTDTVFGSNVGYGAIYGTGSDGIVQIQTNGTSTEMVFRPNNSPASYNSAYWGKIVQANYSFGIYSGPYQSLVLATGNSPGNGGTITFTGAAGTGTDAITINGPTNAGRIALTTYGSSPITLNGGNVLVGTTTGSAKLTVQGSGTTSSTTALLVQNANASASFVIKDNSTAIVGTGTPTTSSIFAVYGNSTTESIDLEVYRDFSAIAGYRTATLRLTTRNTTGNHGGQNIDFRHEGINSSPGTVTNARISNSSLDSGNGPSTFTISTTDTAPYGTTLRTKINIDNYGNIQLTDNTDAYVYLGNTYAYGPRTGKVFTVAGQPNGGFTGDHLIIRGGAAQQSANLTGGNLIIQSGYSTGTAGSNIILQVPIPSGSTGAVLNSTYQTALFISGSGNVGIGTSTPAYKLHVSGSTYLYKSGSTVLDIQGSQGQLFSVVDALSGSLMSVNDVSGLPILEVFSDDRVVMGTYGAPAVTISGSNTVISGSLRGKVVTLSTASATASMDCSLSNFFDLTLSSSMYLVPLNILPGETINLRITQPATSGSLNYSSSIKFPNGLPYTSSATSSVVDLISFISFDSNTLYATAIKNLV